MHSWLCSGRDSRLQVLIVQRALAHVNVDVDSDQVECLLANLIYKVRVKQEGPADANQRAFDVRLFSISGPFERIHFTREANGRASEKRAFPEINW